MEDNKRINLRTTFVYILIIIGAIVTLLPFYSMFLTSFMSYDQAISPSPLWMLPFNSETFANFKDNYLQAFYLTDMSYNIEHGYEALAPLKAFQNYFEDSKFWQMITFQNVTDKGSFATFGTFLFNSFFTTIINTVATIFTTVLAAFAFAKIPFKGKNRLFAILLSTMMVPGEMLLITNLITIYQLNWIDTYQALILPFTASVFYIFLLRQFFKQIPESLYKAARVDGCSDWKFLWKVMVPMSKNTLVTVAVLNALASWNAYLWPLLVTSQANRFVLSVGLIKFTAAINEIGAGAAPAQNIIMAGSTMVVFPMIVLYLILRKQIISGVTRSGTKG